MTSIQAACSIAGFVNCFGCTVHPHFESLGQVDVKVLSLKTCWHLQLQSRSVMFMNFLCKQTVFNIPLETQVWCYGLIWPFYQANAWKKNLGYKGVTITWVRLGSQQTTYPPTWSKEAVYLFWMSWWHCITLFYRERLSLPLDAVVRTDSQCNDGWCNDIGLPRTMWGILYCIIFSSRVHTSAKGQ